MNPEITPKDFFEKRDNHDSFILIDVREDWEFEEENIGGKLFSLYSLPNHLDQLEQWKEMEIIVHCKSGNRSRQAVLYLRQQGFTNVKSLQGGLTAYKAALTIQ